MTFAHETLLTLTLMDSETFKLSCLDSISWHRAFPYSHNMSLGNSNIFKVFSQHGLIKATKVLWTDVWADVSRGGSDQVMRK